MRAKNKTAETAGLRAEGLATREEKIVAACNFFSAPVSPQRAETRHQNQKCNTRSTHTLLS